MKAIRRDKYFRILATVIVDGKDLEQKLIAQKLAKPYEGGTKEWQIIYSTKCKKTGQDK